MLLNIGVKEMLEIYLMLIMGVKEMLVMYVCYYIFVPVKMPVLYFTKHWFERNVSTSFMLLNDGFKEILVIVLWNVSAKERVVIFFFFKCWCQ